MNELPELGVRAHGDLDPRSCIAVAEAAETHGFASLWFAENPFQRGLMPAASACAVTTRRVRIGLGIVNPHTRHPSLIAMEFAALDELAAGRARLGIGAGIGVQIARLGFAWRPLAAMRDAIHIVRGLLAGDEVSYRGRVFSVDRAKLRFRPRSPRTPIYMAAMGDRSLALCGQIADGLIVSNLCPIGYSERAVGIVERPRRQPAGRRPRLSSMFPASRGPTARRRGARPSPPSARRWRRCGRPAASGRPCARRLSPRAASRERNSSPRSIGCAAATRRSGCSTIASSTPSRSPARPRNAWTARRFTVGPESGSWC
jgi:alkanesulfonate monooxygenase SsuD/methylene tetrahydromethanopterin reductase-like flavin-dependent oxidoreductase (luciferase family)